MAGHRPRFLALLLAMGVLTSLSSSATLEQLEQTVEQMKEKSNQLERLVGQLTRQLMLQQLEGEERIRSGSGSGLKQTRQVTQGR